MESHINELCIEKLSKLLLLDSEKRKMLIMFFLDVIEDAVVILECIIGEEIEI